MANRYYGRDGCGSEGGVGLRGTVAVVLIAAVLVSMAFVAPTIGIGGKRSEAVSAIPEPLGSGSQGPVQAAAQPGLIFEHTWGGAYADSASAVTTDSAGNIYVAGLTLSFGACSPSWYALTILKYSATGALLMQKIWSNGSAVFTAGAIGVDPAGNIYVAGSMLWSPCVGGYWYPMLLKFDSLGNPIWGKTVATVDGQFAGLAFDATGNVYVAGTLNNGPAGYQDFLVMKFSPGGAVLWGASWGGASTDVAYGITVDLSGNLYVAGTTYSYPANSPNAVLLKINASGSLLFRKVIGDGNEGAAGVAVDAAGNVYVGGESSTTGSGALLLKFDPTGGLVWQRTWGGPGGGTTVNGIALDPSGNVELAGYTNAFGSGGTCPYINPCPDLALLRIGPSGNLQSQLVYGGGSDDEAYAVADSYGRMVAVGVTSTAPPYLTSTGNQTLGTPNLFVSATANASLGSPSLPIQAIPGGSVSTPSGNVSYAGQTDEFIVEYGTEPTVGFTSTPAAGGGISLNGTTYSNGDSATIAVGTWTATAVPSANYSFVGWNATGGVSVGNALSNTTQVKVLGSGTLTATYEAVSPPSGTPGGSGLSAVELGLIGAVILLAVVVAVLFVLRRRRPGQTQPPPGPPPP